MANALGTLFSDIATAIREKTGDVSTMKPAQFPEKIAAIEAGGGGSLPAGVYWEQKTLLPVAKSGTQFDWNGYRWMVVLYDETTNPDTYYLYKFTNGAWTQVSTFTDNITYTMNVLEYDGELHFFSALGFHSIFNGSSKLIPKTKVGKDCTGFTVFEYNGTLQVITSSNGIYKWNKASDTWTVSDDFTELYQYHYTVHTVNGVPYAFQSTNVLRFEDGAFVKVGVTTKGVSGSTSCVKGKYIYYTNSYNLYRYDTDTNTDELIGLYPPIVTFRLQALSDDIHLYGGSSVQRTDLIMHEVTE